MSQFRRALVLGLTTAFSLALVGPASAAVNTKKVGRIKAQTNKVAKANQSAASSMSHLHHLHQAVVDLRAAEGALGGNNGAKAHKDISAAIHQIEQAMHHHHKHHGTTGSNALIGGLGAAHHHKHHSHLHQAVTDSRAAEKQIKAGNSAAAQKDIGAAIRQIGDALAQHHHTPAKGNKVAALK